MPKSKRIVIIAGEESGDMHAAALVRQLKTLYPDLILTGIGGRHMQAAGVELISDLASYGVTGVTEVIRLFAIIRKAFNNIKAHLKQQPPDLLILVDYPGFNLRLAHYAKKHLNLKIIYYIGPQIWAWKASRIHLIKKCISKMAVILPFEKSIYQKAGVPVNFVGHPLVEKLELAADSQQKRGELGLPLDAKIIALLPGSRRNEIERHMPVLRDTAILLSKQYPDMHFVLPIAGTVNPQQIHSYCANTSIPLTLIQNQALECMAAADFVIVASGTASLECALLQKPMCIIYKSTFLTYHLAMKFINVRFLGLCNLLSGRMLVPEFLQYDCNAEELAHYVTTFFNNKSQPEKMINQLSKLKESLSSSKADCSLLDLVVGELS